MLAVVGRPNVGKSTLVNRMLGRREAVVQDVPGVTRDRVAYDALWNGRRFTRGRHRRLGAGRRRACRRPSPRRPSSRWRTADVVLLVVDATVGATSTDEAVARVLRRSDKPGAAGRDQGRRRPADGRHGRPVVARASASRTR